MALQPFITQGGTAPVGVSTYKSSSGINTVTIGTGIGSTSIHTHTQIEVGRVKFVGWRDAGNSNTTTFEGHLIPTANNTYDIGNAEHKIRDIYEDDSSDIALKEDIVDFTGGLDIIDALKVVSFTWKDNFYKAGKRETGLIAQNVKETLDKSEYYDEKVHYTSSEGIQGLDKKRLIPALISAVQELSKKNTELMKRVDELEDK